MPTPSPNTIMEPSSPWSASRESECSRWSELPPVLLPPTPLSSSSFSSRMSARPFRGGELEKAVPCRTFRPPPSNSELSPPARFRWPDSRSMSSMRFTSVSTIESSDGMTGSGGPGDGGEGDGAGSADVAAPIVAVWAGEGERVPGGAVVLAVWLNYCRRLLRDAPGAEYALPGVIPQGSRWMRHASLY